MVITTMQLWFATFLLSLANLSLANASPSSPMVMGYVSTWSLAENPVLDSPAIQNATHIAYSFLDISKHGECIANEDNGALEKFKTLKRTYSQINTVLSIGGWSQSKYFSDIAVTKQARVKFVRSCLKFVNSYDFDAVDIDWEFPVKEGLPTNHYRPRDAKNQVKLIQEFKQQLSALELENHREKHYEIGVAIPGIKELTKTFDIEGLAQVVNWFGVMAYDLCHKMGCKHSALNTYDSNEPYTLETLHSLLRRGARKDQLVLGLPFYGYLWKKQGGIHQIAKTIGLRELPTLNLNPNHSVLDIDSISDLRRKTRFSIKSDLGGVLIWDLPSDTNELETLKTVRETVDAVKQRNGAHHSSL